MKLKVVFTMIALCISIASAQISRRDAIVQVVEQTGVSIVNISTESVVQKKSPFDDIFEEFFDKYQPRTYKTQSLGSGIIVDNHGFIVTNEHVIRRASEIKVGIYDGSVYTATLIASDTTNDLALLKIEAPNKLLTPITWGTSSDIMIGETAIALGNPFGLESTVTTGVISAKNRALAIEGKINFHDFLQTDAAINPGNSGGALVNVHGELIGINTAIYAQGQGLGFAIPVDRVRSMLAQLLNYSKLKKYFLGLQLSESQNLKNRNVYIKDIEANSSAAYAGLRIGDQIVRVNNDPIHSIFDFNKAIYLSSLGQSLNVYVITNGIARTVKLTVKKQAEVLKSTILWKRLGIDVVPTQKGLFVTKIRKNGPAQRIQVRKGDILVSLGQYRINNIKDAQTFLKFIKKSDAISIILIRGNEHLGGKIVTE